LGGRRRGSGFHRGISGGHLGVRIPARAIPHHPGQHSEPGSTPAWPAECLCLERSRTGHAPRAPPRPDGTGVCAARRGGQIALTTRAEGMALRQKPRKANARFGGPAPPTTRPRDTPGSAGPGRPRTTQARAPSAPPPFTTATAATRSAPRGGSASRRRRTRGEAHHSRPPGGASRLTTGLCPRAEARRLRPRT
jgi:hypothetical protein